MAEAIAVFYIFYIKELILFIKKSEPYDKDEGVRLIAVFGISALISTILRNYSHFYAERLAIRAKKTLSLVAY